MFGKKENQDLKFKISDLENENRRLERECKEYQSKYWNLDGINTKLEKRIKELEEQQELNELSDSLKAKEQELKEIQNNYNELLDQFNNTNLENERLKQDISVKSKEIEAYKQAINNISLTFQKVEKSDNQELPPSDCTIDDEEIQLCKAGD